MAHQQAEAQRAAYEYYMRQQQEFQLQQQQQQQSSSYPQGSYIPVPVYGSYPGSAQGQYSYPVYAPPVSTPHPLPRQQQQKQPAVGITPSEVKSAFVHVQAQYGSDPAMRERPTQDARALSHQRQKTPQQQQPPRQQQKPSVGDTESVPAGGIQMHSSIPLDVPSPLPNSPATSGDFAQVATSSAASTTHAGAADVSATLGPTVVSAGASSIVSPSISITPAVTASTPPVDGSGSSGRRSRRDQTVIATTTAPASYPASEGDSPATRESEGSGTRRGGKRGGGRHGK